MFVAHLLFALVIGFILTLVFAVGFRRSGPWGSVAIFFAIVFLLTWAGGLWIAPFGPSLWGVYWLPFFIVGLLFALLLAASGPSRPPRNAQEAVEGAKAEIAVQSILNLFLWLLIVGLIAGIIVHYYYIAS